MLTRPLCAASALLISTGLLNAPAIAQSEDKANPWYTQGQQALELRKKNKANKKKAKNVILFIGDGMDPTTVAAARILEGQMRHNEGEGNLLSFEEFPHVAYSKTYTVDYQVADSAGTASAMVTGVKTRSGVLSISEDAERGDCVAGIAARVATIAEQAEQAGLSIGVVSTAEVTHATPASNYAHSADRDWADDSELPDEAKEAGCKDIARQLIEFPYGDGVDVVLGGGRRRFLPTTVSDPEYPEAQGQRLDGRNLTEEWAAKSVQHRYVWNKADFDAAPADSKLLGLFERSHAKYAIEVPYDGAGEPDLAEMTAKAIEILSANDEGYFLMVEGGRIDHAHHGGNAYRALTDTIAYSDAVETARSMTSEKDTLIIVTADHGHTLSFQGYPMKDNPIMGLVQYKNDEGEVVPLPAGADQKPYTTLSYANGPGTVFREGADLSEGRTAPTQEEATHYDYRQQALIPTGGETHGGQDVPVYASGPKAYLISGVFEQNYIYHVMADALGLD